VEGKGKELADSVEESKRKGVKVKVKGVLSVDVDTSSRVS